MRKILCVLLLVVGCGRAPKKPVWIIEGCASTSRATYNLHQISPEALEEAVENIGEYRTVLFGHNSARAVGRITEAVYEHRSLRVTIIISPSEDALWQKIREGTITGLSISVMPIEQEYAYFEDLCSDGALATRVVICEISIVSVPANPDCRITNWRVRYE